MAVCELERKWDKKESIIKRTKTSLSKVGNLRAEVKDAWKMSLKEVMSKFESKMRKDDQKKNDRKKGKTVQVSISRAQFLWTEGTVTQEQFCAATAESTQMS